MINKSNKHTHIYTHTHTHRIVLTMLKCRTQLISDRHAMKMRTVRERGFSSDSVAPVISHPANVAAMAAAAGKVRKGNKRRCRYVNV